jgi:hypothetical protein
LNGVSTVRPSKSLQTTYVCPSEAFEVPLWGLLLQFPGPHRSVFTSRRSRGSSVPIKATGELQPKPRHHGRIPDSLALRVGTCDPGDAASNAKVQTKKGPTAAHWALGPHGHQSDLCPGARPRHFGPTTISILNGYQTVLTCLAFEKTRKRFLGCFRR